MATIGSGPGGLSRRRAGGLQVVVIEINSWCVFSLIAAAVNHPPCDEEPKRRRNACDTPGYAVLRLFGNGRDSVGGIIPGSAVFRR